MNTIKGWFYVMFTFYKTIVIFGEHEKQMAFQIPFFRVLLLFFFTAFGQRKISAHVAAKIPLLLRQWSNRQLFNEVLSSNNRPKSHDNYLEFSVTRSKICNYSVLAKWHWHFVDSRVAFHRTDDVNENLNFNLSFRVTRIFISFLSYRPGCLQCIDLYNMTFERQRAAITKCVGNGPTRDYFDSKTTSTVWFNLTLTWQFSHRFVLLRKWFRLSFLRVV